MSTPTIKFYYKATKRPKLLENNVFVLYSPQKLKFQPGEKKIVDMKIKIEFPPNTIRKLQAIVWTIKLWIILIK